MSTRTWTMLTGPAQATRGFVLYFARTRTKIEDVAVNLEGVRPKFRPAYKLALARWDEGSVRDGGEVEISVEYLGDTPVIAGFAWISDKSRDRGSRLLPGALKKPEGGLLIQQDLENIPAAFRPLLRQERSRVGIRPRVVAHAQVQHLVAALELSAEEIFRRRRESIEADLRIQVYFEALDRGSHPDLASADLLVAAEQVSYALNKRIEERAWHGTARAPAPSQCPVYPPLPPVGDVLAEREPLIKISTFMRGLVELHLMPPLAGPAAEYPETGAMDLTAWAFEQFATDSSTVFHLDPNLQDLLQTHGAPNGSEFFKFAELAFACVDSDIDRDFWEPHLETFTRVAQIFVENSRVPLSAVAAMGMSQSYGFEPGRYFPTDRRQILQSDYLDTLAGSTPEQRLVQLQDRFTSILAQALPDTLESTATAPLRDIVYSVTIERVRES